MTAFLQTNVSVLPLVTAFAPTAIALAAIAWVGLGRAGALQPQR